MELKGNNLQKWKAPIVFPSTSIYSFHNPTVSVQENEITLYFDVTEKKETEVISYKAKSSTKDCCQYSKFEMVKAEEIISTVNFVDARTLTGFYCKYEEVTAGNQMGSIVIAISKDKKHWITFAQDQETFPEHGIVYDGDYYRALPFREYIQQDTIPEGNIFDIREYGAIPDGKTLSTQAFLAASEAARDAGGGTILVTGGHYCIGTVSLYSHCTLFIDKDAALVASKNLEQYKDALIVCNNQESVTIKGGGKIIGNGEYFVYLPLKRPLLHPMEYTKLPPVPYDPMGYPVDSIRYAYRARIRYAEDRYAEGLSNIKRPMYMVWIRESQNVSIENIILEDAMSWTLCIDFCSNVTVKDVVINGNRHVANTDGIDIMGSQYVEIKHCFISCADDGLCIKAPLKQGHDGITIEDKEAKMGPASHIHISDCTVVTVMNAFKIGTETYYDIHDVLVENCKFMMPDLYPGSVSGISIESSDGSNVYDITVRNIEMDRVCCPIFICQNMRNKFGFLSEEDALQKKYGGSIHDISIQHIVAYHIEVPSIITGFATFIDGKNIEKQVENIKISDFHAVYEDNIERLSIREHIHESITDYPENNSFGDVPAYGFYIRHAKEVEILKCEIIPRTMNTRDCIFRD